MSIVVALVAGLLFGAGLTISQMVDPEKVLGFLDVGAIPAGGWDPSLAFVMLGALAVTAPAFAFARGRSRSLLGLSMQMPSRRDIDAPLVLGALCFGAGWGLVGFCPGPAVAALSIGGAKVLVFVGAMLVGMALHGYAVERGGPVPARN